MKLYTCDMGKELYEEDKSFYAENINIYGNEDTEVFELEVEHSVSLQIQYEKNGVKVYQVNPEQVLSIIKVKC